MFIRMKSQFVSVRTVFLSLSLVQSFSFSKHRSGRSPPTNGFFFRLIRFITYLYICMDVYIYECMYVCAHYTAHIRPYYCCHFFFVFFYVFSLQYDNTSHSRDRVYVPARVLAQYTHTIYVNGVKTKHQERERGGG